MAPTIETVSSLCTYLVRPLNADSHRRTHSRRIDTSFVRAEHLTATSTQAKTAERAGKKDVQTFGKWRLHCEENKHVSHLSALVSFSSIHHYPGNL